MWNGRFCPTCSVGRRDPHMLRMINSIPFCTRERVRDEEREIEAELQTYRRQEQHNTHPLFCNLINRSSALCSPEAKHTRIHTHPPLLSHLIWVTSMMFTAGCWLSEWCHAKFELSLLLFRSVFWFVSMMLKLLHASKFLHVCCVWLRKGFYKWPDVTWPHVCSWRKGLEYNLGLF